MHCVNIDQLVTAVGYNSVSMYAELCPHTAITAVNQRKRSRFFLLNKNDEFRRQYEFTK